MFPNTQITGWDQENFDEGTARLDTKSEARRWNSWVFFSFCMNSALCRSIFDEKASPLWPLPPKS